MHTPILIYLVELPGNFGGENLAQGTNKPEIRFNRRETRSLRSLVFCVRPVFFKGNSDLEQTFRNLIFIYRLRV